MLSGWSYYKTITLSAPNASLTDFPFFVVITTDPDIGAHALGTGYDIRFTLTDDTLLYYERWAFSVAGGLATGLFRVQLPSWSAVTGATIRCYYGNAAASDGNDPENTYETNYKGVWKFNASGALDCTDSTANNNDGTNYGAVSAAGPIAGMGAATGFSNAPTYITIGQSNFPTGSSARTVSAWCYPTASGVYPTILNYGTASDNLGYTIQLNDATRYLDVFGYNNQPSSPANTQVPLNLWTYLALTFAGTSLSYYYNGSPDGTATHNNINTVLGSGARIGNTIDGWGGDGAYPWFGSLAMPTLSSIVRSAAWIKAEYQNVALPGNLQTWGVEVATSVARPIFSFGARHRGVAPTFGGLVARRA